MGISENIKKLRTDILKMSRADFGKAIGISGAMVRNLDEEGRLIDVEQKEPIFRLICNTFDVRMEWLKEGEEPVFELKQNDVIHEIAAEMGLSGEAESFIKLCIGLPAEHKEAIYNVAKLIVGIYGNEAAPASDAFAEDPDPEAVLARAMEKKQRQVEAAWAADAEAYQKRAFGSSTSTSTPGTAGSADFAAEIG